MSYNFKSFYQPGSRSTLSVKLNSRYSKSNKSGKQWLLHIAILLECHILDDGRQLVVISYHNPTLQTIETVMGILKCGKPKFNNTIELLRKKLQTWSNRGMKVSISKIWAASSIRMLSNLKSNSTKSFRLKAAWVQVIAIILASLKIAIIESS